MLISVSIPIYPNVESLILEYSNDEIKFPASFFEIVKRFTSLKKLKFAATNDMLDQPYAPANGEYPMHHLATILKDLPSLELLDISMPQKQFKWPTFANLTKLLVPLWAFKSEYTFEVFRHSYAPGSFR